ncbi:electron transport complex subunit E [Guyparkeria sp.]|uniref:electron transport complex subunit E n=1 Tax=Guyparkeria sp. TaxID=2035736 RepID=UPI0035683A90
MSDPRLSELALDGLWKNNPALVQVLGLCPLLAISNTTVNALGLAIATLVTLVVANGVVSLIRDWVRSEVRLPVYVMVIASVVTIIELVMNAHFHSLYNTLGIFIPLIVTNCIIIARAEGFASRHAFGFSVFDGFVMGAGFGLVLVALGAMREIIGFGTLLDGADQLFGPVAMDWGIRVLPEQMTFLLALMPPGAFIGLALLVAFKQGIDQRAARRARAIRAARSGKPVEAAC